MYQKKFKIEGLDADIASRGKEAIEKSSGGYDLIILDILLPEVDGFDILKTIKSNPDTVNIPVIILTNLGTSQVLVREGMKLGAKDYLIKSQISAKDVVDKVKSYLPK
jgi:DNA-binding response OmpR family regulator